MSLINQLVKNGILKKEEADSLEYEMKTSNKREEDLILEKQIVPEQVLFDIKSKMLKINLKKVASGDVSLEVLKLIPEQSARYYKIIPLFYKDKIIEIGMVYPEDIKAKEALEFLARQENFKYNIVLITLSTFNNILKQYKSLKKEVGKALEELETELEEKKEKKENKEKITERIVEDAPISKMVEVILRHAVDGNASDIHIEPTKENLRIRFRLDGILYSSLFLPLKTHSAVVARIKILSNLKIDESRIPQDGRFSTIINEKDIDFRVSTFPTTLGEKVVLRVLDSSQGLKKLKALGLNVRDITIIRGVIKKSYGLILITGPTGCGKSTTLYTILQLLNKQSVNIVTLEDPVEYFIKGVNQSQVRPEIGYSFEQGLRHILRQDPDVIMVGEIRDKETASLAIHAALTGHIVLSTLHTTNVLGVIPRLIDLEIAPFLIQASLSLSISQRLVRKLCIHCKKKIKLNSQIKEMLLREIQSMPDFIQKKIKSPDQWAVFKADGCRKCRQEGYSGRVAIFETLEMTKIMSDTVLKEPSEENIGQEAKKQGIITMKQDGILKVLQGITSIEEVIRATEEE